MTAPERRWLDLADRLGFGASAGPMYAELAELYGQRHRAYHDLRHVTDCLGLLDRYPLQGTDPVALELAFWYHDAIYQPLRGDNEQKSADLARERLGQAGLAEARLDKIHRLILVTLHDGTARDLDERLMVDIDLAVLGSPVEVYDRYETAIRREYRLVPGPLYRRKRKAILRSFLEREAIYSTESLHRELESNARANLERAIAAL